MRFPIEDAESVKVVSRFLRDAAEPRTGLSQHECLMILGSMEQDLPDPLQNVQSPYRTPILAVVSIFFSIIPIKQP